MITERHITLIFCYISLHSSGKAFHKILEAGYRYVLPWFSHKSFSELDHWCWVIRPKVLDGDGVSILCRPVKFFRTKTRNHFLRGLKLCTGTLLCWNHGKGSSPNYCHNDGHKLMSKNIVVVCCSFSQKCSCFLCQCKLNRLMGSLWGYCSL